ncbi:hypothetical protein ACFL3J_01150 [Candidatus Omnitrophota bacterium]
MLKIFYIFIALFYICCLPGYMITRLFFEKEGFFATLILSFALSFILIPIISFGVAMILHTVVNELLVFSIATLINIIGSASIIYKRKAGKHLVKSEQ